MYVVKANGVKEDFDEGKIINTCMRAGVSHEKARMISRRVKSYVKNGTTTHKVYMMVLEELDKVDEKSLFMLRESVANLDPVSFEIYVKKILEAMGYKCQWDKTIQGKYVDHQVDVLASKEKSFIVECKRHFNPHRFTGLGICLQVEARLQDIRNGSSRYRPDSAWIVTNTKFSEHAKQYAKGIGIRLTGWRYDDDYSMEGLIKKTRMLPVTTLKVDISIHKFLLRRKIITLQDLIKQKPKTANIKDIVNQARSMINKL